MSKRIAVLGGSGQLGKALQAVGLPNALFLDRTALDLSNLDAVKRYFEANRFDTIVNCAAYTAVDQAESEPDEAKHLNNELVHLLGTIAKDHHISLIQISTDYVFNGNAFRPYKESDMTDPQGVYGSTKRAGEEALLAINPPKSAIIRTSWVYSEFGNNFVKTMLRLGSERDSLGVIYDQVGSPTYASDLAQAIISMTEQLNGEGTEVYHFSNEGVCSWYDFAKAIFDIAGIECQVNPIETHEYPTPAKRPAYSVLNKAKIKDAFSLEIPYWRDSLKNCIKQLKESS